MKIIDWILDFLFKKKDNTRQYKVVDPETKKEYDITTDEITEEEFDSFVEEAKEALFEIHEKREEKPSLHLKCTLEKYDPKKQYHKDDAPEYSRYVFQAEVERPKGCKVYAGAGYRVDFGSTYMNVNSTMHCSNFVRFYFEEVSYEKARSDFIDVLTYKEINPNMRKRDCTSFRE